MNTYVKSVGITDPSEIVRQLLVYAGFDKAKYKDGVPYQLRLDMMFTNGLPSLFTKEVMEEQGPEPYKPIIATREDT